MKKTMERINKGIKNLDKRKKFTSEYQPSPEAKKEGWRKRKLWHEIGDLIMDELVKYYKMPMKNIKEQLEDLKRDDGKYMPYQIQILKAVLDKEFFRYFLDKVVKRLQVEIEGEISIKSAQETFDKLKNIIVRSGNN